MAYLLRRLAFGALTLFVISILVFILARASGDPAELLFPLSAGATVEQQREFRREYGLDQTLPIQYWVFISHALRGDFGKSLQFGTPAMSEVLSRAPATLLLAVSSTMLAVVIGVPFGVLAAVRPNSWYDNVFKAFAVFGHAAPVYWIGLMMIWLFAAILRVLPSSGSGTPAHLVMPMIVQAWASLAILMRLTR